MPESPSDTHEWTEEDLKAAMGPIDGEDADLDEGSDGEPDGDPDNPDVGNRGQADELDGSTEEPADPDKGEDGSPPDGESAVDLEPLPEFLRDEAAKLSPKAQREIVDGYLRRSDYSKKTSEVSAVRSKAEAFDSLLEDKEAAALLSDLRTRRLRAEANGQDGDGDEDEIDFDTATSDEIKAHLNKVRDRAVDRALEAFRKERESERAEMSREHSVLRVASEMHAESGLSEQEFAGHVKEAREFVRDTFDTELKDLEPEKARKILSRFVPRKKGRAQEQGRRSAVSPAGRSTGGRPPQPEWMRQGREPRTREEIDQSFKLQLEKIAGRPVTDAEVDQALKRGW